MRKVPAEAGCIARSTAGRDEGRLFLVVGEIDTDFVTIADGELRKMVRPKKKRRKHLIRVKDGVPAEKAAKMRDYEIRNLLAAAGTNEEG